jgi:ABC-type multidrug transport system fused ATPase/permease subunit
MVQNGRIAERGTHAALLEEDGLYADLCRRQFREPVGEAVSDG